MGTNFNSGMSAIKDLEDRLNKLLETQGYFTEKDLGREYDHAIGIKDPYENINYYLDDDQIGYILIDRDP